MPESPEELWARVHGALQVPPVEEWDTWPFDGELSVRPLAAPVEREEPRFGEGGVDCRISTGGSSRDPRGCRS